MSRIAVILAFVGLMLSTFAAQAAWTETCVIPTSTVVGDAMQKPETETKEETEEETEEDEEPDCE